MYIIGTYCSLHSDNNIESRDFNDVKISMALYSLIGRRHCSAVSRKTVRKCFTASIWRLCMYKIFHQDFD